MNTLNDDFVNKMCRICLSACDVKSINIFSVSPKFGIPLANTLAACAPVQVVRNDGLPNVICNFCYTELERAYEFQMLAVQSERTLDAFLKRPRNAVDPLSNENEYNKNVIEQMAKKNLRQKRKIVDVNSQNTSDVKAQIMIEPDFSHMLNNFGCVPVNHYENETTQVFAKNKTNSRKLKIETNAADQTKHEQMSVDYFQRHGLLRIDQNILKLSEETNFNNERENANYNEVPILGACVETETMCKIQSYNCTICQKNFKQFSNLQTHLKKIHNDKKESVQVERQDMKHKPYRCELCEKRFSSSISLVGHRRIHTGEKPFHCEICSKAFSRNYYLNVHRRVHTGEKPYRCDICHKYFSQPSVLYGHRRQHTGEKPYRCESCDKSFTHLSGLRNHKCRKTE